MQLDDYQKAARETAVYPPEYAGVYPALGLCGEAGELLGRLADFYRGDAHETTLHEAVFFLHTAGLVAEAVKKYLRDGRTPDRLRQIRDAAGLASRACSGLLDCLEDEDQSDQFPPVPLPEEDLGGLLAEAGDVGWYWAGVCHDLGASLSEVARQNLEKLASRKERGKLHGSGDDR